VHDQLITPYYCKIVMKVTSRTWHQIPCPIDAIGTGLRLNIINQLQRRLKGATNQPSGIKDFQLSVCLFSRK
jgi:hypothetical protein